MDGIILIFRKNLDVRIVDDIAPTFVDLNDRFSVIHNNEFNGYYNLLRNDNTKVIGIEYYPFEPDVSRALADFDYVSSHFAENGDCELTIYFGTERDEVHNLTILQELGKNYIYQSETGLLAASFGVPFECMT